MNKRTLVIELSSDEKMDLDFLIDSIHSTIFNSEDTGVQHWDITEMEEDLVDG